MNAIRSHRRIAGPGRLAAAVLLTLIAGLILLAACTPRRLLLLDLPQVPGPSVCVAQAVAAPCS
jgi:hypothetical protein